MQNLLWLWSWACIQFVSHLMHQRVQDSINHQMQEIKSCTISGSEVHKKLESQKTISMDYKVNEQSGFI